MEWETIKNTPKITIKEKYINIPSSITKEIETNTVQALYNGREIAFRACKENEPHKIKIYKSKYQGTIKNKDLINTMLEYGYKYERYEVEKSENKGETIYIIKK